MWTPASGLIIGYGDIAGAPMFASAGGLLQLDIVLVFEGHPGTCMSVYVCRSLQAGRTGRICTSVSIIEIRSPRPFGRSHTLPKTVPCVSRDRRPVPSLPDEPLPAIPGCGYFPAIRHTSAEIAQQDVGPSRNRKLTPVGQAGLLGSHPQFGRNMLDCSESGKTARGGEGRWTLEQPASSPTPVPGPWSGALLGRMRPAPPSPR